MWQLRPRLIEACHTVKAFVFLCVTAVGWNTLLIPLCGYYYSFLAMPSFTGIFGTLWRNWRQMTKLKSCGYWISKWRIGTFYKENLKNNHLLMKWECWIFRKTMVQTEGEREERLYCSGVPKFLLLYFAQFNNVCHCSKFFKVDSSGIWYPLGWDIGWELVWVNWWFGTLLLVGNLSNQWSLHELIDGYIDHELMCTMVLLH